jgi:twitching motility two-component system response regulator PilH
MSRVLVVDDSSFQRKNLARILGTGGHETVEAADGKAAFGMYADHAPDLVLVDLIMPDMPGMEFLRLAAGGPAPIIVVTADIQDEVRRECLDLGAHAVMNKPVRAEELLAAVAAATALRPGRPEGRDADLG